MSNEPIPFPRNLEEDWRLAEKKAETTPPRKEPSPEVTSSEHVQEILPLYIDEVLAVAPEGKETAPDEWRAFLCTVADERPMFENSANDPDDRVRHTHGIMKRLGKDLQDKEGMRLAHWGRMAGLLLADMPLDRADKIHLRFTEALSSDDTWKQLVQVAKSMTENDEVLQAKVEALVQFMARPDISKDVTTVREMILLGLAQVQYWRDTQAARLTRKVIERLEREGDDSLREPSPIVTHKVGPNRFTKDELTDLPLEVIAIDPYTSDTVKPSGIVESELTHRGEVVQHALAMWPFMKMIVSGAGPIVSQTRNQMHRAGAGSDPRLSTAHWMRHIAYLQAGLSFDTVTEIRDYYLKYHSKTQEEWKTFARQVVETYVPEGSDTYSMLDSCMVVAGVPTGSAGEFARMMYAMTMDEIEFWRNMRQFESETWQESLQEHTALTTSELPTYLHEPNVPRMLRGLEATQYTEDDLLPLSMEEIAIAPGSNEIIPSEIVEPELNTRGEWMYVAVSARTAADKRRILDNNPNNFRPTENIVLDLAQKLTAEGNSDDVTVAHRARYLAFVLAKTNYTKYQWDVHNSKPTNHLDKRALGDFVEDAFTAAYRDKSMAERVEICLPFIAETDEQTRLARQVICIVLAQIRSWKERKQTAGRLEDEEWWYS